MTERQSVREWHYRDLAQVSPAQGPFHLDELIERFQSGKLRPDDLVCRGSGKWVQANRMPELAEAIRNQRSPDELSSQIADDAARIVRGDSGFQRTLEYNRDPRNLRWQGLFVGGLLLSLLMTALMTLRSIELAVSALVLVTLGTISSAMILTAVIRRAVQPLFARMVDNNAYLKEIAAELRDARLRDRQPK